MTCHSKLFNFVVVKKVNNVNIVNNVLRTNLRIHIIPVGFEFRRVTKPLADNPADKVYLVTKSPNDAAFKFLEDIKKELANSEYRGIEVIEKFVDIWDLYECIGKFREIISQEKGNHIYVNVSTGTKITAIAGMLSCMLLGAEPYYVSVEYPNSLPKPDIPEYKILKANAFPAYGIKKPELVSMKILNELQKYDNPMRKNKLIDALEGIKVIEKKDSSGEERSSPAKLNQLTRLLEPMSDWKFIEVKGKGNNVEVSITFQGKIALRVFGVEEGIPYLI